LDATLLSIATGVLDDVTLTKAKIVSQDKFNWLYLHAFVVGASNLSGEGVAPFHH
jgi:hypothetical protein